MWTEIGIKEQTQREPKETLPKREILCLTRAASLQNRLGKKDGKERIKQKKLQREQRRGEISKVSKEIRTSLRENMKDEFCTLRWEDKPLNRKNLTQDNLISQIVFLPGHHLLLFVGGTAADAQVLAGCGQEVETVVLKSLICQRKQHLERRNAAMRLQVNILTFQCSVARDVNRLPDLRKELDFLVVRRFVRLPTGGHGLWINNKNERQGQCGE